VQQGEVLGIIGRNGAGKSTLLKILAQVTAPTEGLVKYKGRIASLLEVGTGFHPDLTGRENIYLNGAILGMTKEEVRSKFDEIVSFAEIQKFIDTPVKRYSSGMYVRLAFAVAAHLDPEILLVDEVLAVGDAAFQKKCLGKMGDVAREGRTVLFVSHNMATVTALCRRGIVLVQGKIEIDTHIEGAVHAYLASANANSRKNPLNLREDREGDGTFRFTSISYRTSLGVTDTLVSGKEAYFEIDYETKSGQMLSNADLQIEVMNQLGLRIFICETHATNDGFSRIFPKGQFILSIPRLPLREGTYYINLWGYIKQTIADGIREAGTFNVEEGDYFNTGRLTKSGQGFVFVDHSFGIEPVEKSLESH